MTIHLAAEVRSGLGEDTFWEWASRSFPGATFDPPPAELPPESALLQYSTLGPPASGGNTIALCWELLPEMKLQLGGRQWDATIERTRACAAACRRRAVASTLALPFYSDCGPCDVLPIGVDTDLFKPVTPEQQCGLRAIHGIPTDRRIGFWMGTNHSMKGADRLEAYARENPDIFWLVVWKTRHERGRPAIASAQHYTHISQQHLAELMQCADFFLSAGRLRPFYLIEWEAMAANLPMVNISGLEKDFVVGLQPREQIFELGWDRTAARRTWLEYIAA